MLCPSPSSLVHEGGLSPFLAEKEKETICAAVAWSALNGNYELQIKFGCILHHIRWLCFYGLWSVAKISADMRQNKTKRPIIKIKKKGEAPRQELGAILHGGCWISKRWQRTANGWRGSQKCHYLGFWWHGLKFAGMGGGNVRGWLTASWPLVTTCKRIFVDFRMHPLGHMCSLFFCLYKNCHSSFFAPGSLFSFGQPFGASAVLYPL